MSDIKPFINQYNWKENDFPSYRKDWKKFESNNKSIALNILYVPYNTKYIRPAHVSKHNYKHKNQVILLMITDGKKWHYLAVKNFSALLRGITSIRNGKFYFINCPHSSRTKNKFKKYKSVFKYHDYWCIEMPKKYNKRLKYIHRQKCS